MDHGRKIYAYDPVSLKMVMARYIRLTSGYDPAPLSQYPAKRTAAPDAVVNSPSSYSRHATFTYDPASGRWDLSGGAPEGVDTLVTTRHGVMGVNVDWPSRLNDAGYNRPGVPRSHRKTRPSTSSTHRGKSGSASATGSLLRRTCTK